MPISENLARVLRRVKAERQLSFAEFAEELAIPKSSLEKYLSGTGNPRADTLEMLAKDLRVPLTEIVSGPLPGWEQAETMVCAAKALSGLPPERQERGIQLFQELAALFGDNR